MNNSNMNDTMNMNDSDETILPPLFRSMNFMAPPPSLVFEEKDKGQKIIALKNDRNVNRNMNIPFVHTTTWATTPNALRKLGYYHPLDPSHVTFERDALETVLQGLTKAFMALSCDVTYSTDALTATAVTMQGVEFQVTLWASKSSANNNDPKQGDIICELQRVAGDSYTYHAQYAQPILRAVAAADYTCFDCNNNNYSDNHSMSTCGKALDQVDLLQTESTDDEDDIATALELAADMVLCDRYDSCLLGMESLLCLTNPNCTGNHTATAVATELATSNTAHPVVKFLVTQLLQPASQELQFAALRIWVQVWQVLAAAASSKTLMNHGKDDDNLFVTNQVVDLLIQMVHHADQAPHLATLALQGLTALHQLQHPAVVETMDDTAPVAHAAAVGQARHAALYAASHQMLLLAVHA